MAYQHTNRKGKTVFLHQGVSSAGRPKYFFSPKADGSLVDALPEGYEVYENPNAQVFLRKIQPRIITAEEVALIRKAMQRYSAVKLFQVASKKNAVLVYLPDQDTEALAALFEIRFAGNRAHTKETLDRFVTYSPRLRFVLRDVGSRIFVTERFCFLGAIDDWIQVGVPGSLGDLAREYIPHLGKDSYYELF